MSRVPVAIPLAWTKPGLFFLQSMRFRHEIGSDCLRHQEFIR
jgi:hypothetical protein